MLVGADGVAAADDLIQHLHSPTLRCDALNRLRQLPSSALTNVSGIAPALAPCLTDPNATVILHALQLIANLAPVLAPLSLPKLAPHLIDALAHPKSVVSDRTLRTLSVLAETSPDIVVDALDVCGFRNCDANVRCEALSAFAFLFTRNVLKSTALFPEIRRLADNDTDAHVRQVRGCVAGRR
ncbi:TOG domain-containing protein [Plasmodiophora brassicae]